jgi:hypothetical protein
MKNVSCSVPGLEVFQTSYGEYFVSANSFVQVATEQKSSGAARKTFSRLIHNHTTLLPERDISKSEDVLDWTFTYTTKKGASAVLLSLDAMEYVLDALTGTIENKKEALKLLFQTCKASFPSKNRGPTSVSPPMNKKGRSSHVPVHAIARVVSAGEESAVHPQAVKLDEDSGMSHALAGYSDPDQMIKKAFEAMSRQDKAAFCLDLALKVKTHGYVYVAWNPSFPTLLKIGATARQNPYIRLKELSTAGVPGKFELVCCMATMNPFQLEKQIHAHFKTRRSFGYRKEFFEVPVDEAVAYFDQLVADGGVSASGNNAVPESSGLKSLKKRGVNQISTPISSEEGATLAKALSRIEAQNAEILAQMQKGHALMEAQHADMLTLLEKFGGIVKANRTLSAEE